MFNIIEVHDGVYSNVKPLYASFVYEPASGVANVLNLAKRISDALKTPVQIARSTDGILVRSDDDEVVLHFPDYGTEMALPNSVFSIVIFKFAYFKDTELKSSLAGRFHRIHQPMTPVASLIPDVCIYEAIFAFISRLGTDHAWTQRGTITITQSEGNIIKEITKMNESKLESDFDHIVEGQLQRCRDILVKKGDEYATDSDRLHNFRVASEITGQTMEQALAGMMVKHTTSVYDMIYSGKAYSKEMWDEKITDHMVYLLLLQVVLDSYRPEAV